MESKKHSILVVDDDANLLESLVNLLKYNEFKVDFVQSGRKALEYLNNKCYDLIISDIDMPLMDGLELLDRIRKTISLRVPVILITGHVTSDYAIQAIRLGVSDFISKPLEFNSLLKIIKTILSKKTEIEKHQLFNEKLNDFHADFAFSPNDFIELNIPELITSYILHNFELPSHFIYEIYQCLDELLNNAFIHGTLEIQKDIRESNFEIYNSFIKESVQAENIMSKTIIVKLFYQRQLSLFKFEISDQGKGFDYKKELGKNSSVVNFNQSGRGISLVKILASSLNFFDGGRTVVFEKELR